MNHHQNEIITTRTLRHKGSPETDLKRLNLGDAWCHGDLVAKNHYFGSDSIIVIINSYTY